MVEIKEGWAPCYGSLKWHYFVEGRSLCRNFGLLFSVKLEQGSDDSPDNCATCRKKLERRKLKEQ